MGVLPLQFLAGENAASHGLTGEETFTIEGLGKMTQGQKIKVKVTFKDGKTKEITAQSRIDTLNELEYYQHGGILPYVMRQILKS
jgi:aconitate hydratase